MLKILLTDISQCRWSIKTTRLTNISLCCWSMKTTQYTDISSCCWSIKPTQLTNISPCWWSIKTTWLTDISPCWWSIKTTRLSLSFTATLTSFSTQSSASTAEEKKSSLLGTRNYPNISITLKYDTKQNKKHRSEVVSSIQCSFLSFLWLSLQMLVFVTVLSVNCPELNNFTHNLDKAVHFKKLFAVFH